ncbi:hypothetical protein SDC9_148325 [bioreactor metagenome]|uniref:Uncharacterized protein n=1 Tax=bioreactor metagenome TaxID=1076179 RepID=A0A645EIN2_9ZZZZ
MQDGVPVRYLDVIALDLAQNFRAVNEAVNQNFKGRGYLNSEVLLHKGRDEKQKEGENAQGKTLPLAEEGAPDRHQNDRGAQHHKDGKGDFVRLDLVDQAPGLFFFFLKIGLCLYHGNASA